MERVRRIETLPRVLVLRALKLGDLLVAVPALRGLRAAYPRHRLQLATSAWLAPIVDLLDCVDEMIPTTGLRPLRVRPEPDVAVNLHAVGPPSTDVLDALRPRVRIGFGGGWGGPRWRDAEHERDRWCRLLAAHGIAADPADVGLARPPVTGPTPGAVVVHPGAAYGAKRWPAERFAAVARALASAGDRVVLTGAAGEQPLAERVAHRAGLPASAVFAGRTDLTRLAALVADARLVVTGDTGVAHLSYAYRTPSVVLFGPAAPENWGPPNGPHVALSADADRVGDPFAETPDPALLAVTVADVRAAVAALDRRYERASASP